MSRVFAFPLVSDVLALAYLVTITRRDGTIQRFTTAQADFTQGGITWKAVPGVELSKIEYRADGSVANAEVKAAAKTGGFLSPADVKNRKYNGATILIRLASLL
jgi:hypothetical protein